MNQTDELIRVKARIKALAERTVARGCTEAEALAAAEMVGRLLDRYALSMDEVEIRAEPCIRLEVPLGSHRRRPIDGCVPAIARFCDCKVWLAREEHGACYVFFGFQPDTSLAGYLFAVIDRAIATALVDFRSHRPRLGGTALRQASANFQHGMASRIAERLENMLVEREAGLAAQSSTGTALVIVKHQVVEEAFRASPVRLVASRGLRAHHDAAFHHGRAAGEQVNLNRPVEGRERTRLT